MRQILQDMSNGDSTIVESPVPAFKKGHLLINTTTTLISAGTERMLVDFGKANFIDKARQQPDKVKMVLDKAKTDGLMVTIDAVKSKLAQPLPLGYCNVGVVSSVDSSVAGFKEGDRVISNGSHADVVRVPKNLAATIPNNVTDEEAAFTVVASIGLQGIRLAKPTMGECFVVTGVGLIGLLTVQMLRNHGCRVLAIDYDEEKLALAEQYGAETCNPGKGQDPVAVGMSFSRGVGVDGVIITASTKSNDPVTQAAKMSRKRGRIILVGVTGLELSRADFYEKELTFQVSCSYGPGRYDSEYEENGNDYPVGFVRWTQKRNFEAILDMMSSGILDVTKLISHRFNFDNAVDAYDLLTTNDFVLGILLRYGGDIQERHVKSIDLHNNASYTKSNVIVSFIGAGNYASRMLIPSFRDGGAKLDSISTSGGVNGVVHGKKLGFATATTDTDSMINSNDNNTVVIVTQHNSHANFVKKALEAKKNVFVEKPLALNHEELNSIESLYKELIQLGHSPKLMVGFNRRFSPHIQKMKQLISTTNEPKSLIMTMNAGFIPADHWTQNNDIGGGRIIGEACHYIDLMRYLVGFEIVSVQARRMENADSSDTQDDKASITLGFSDGSFGTIHYFANGASSFPKERIEVFSSGKVLQLDNFVKLKGFGWKGFKKLNLWKQDKGQKQCSELFIKSIQNGLACPIPALEIFEVARVSIDIAESLRNQ